jgi:hypothetical protein
MSTGETTADERAIVRGEEIIATLERNMPSFSPERQALASRLMDEAREAVAMARRRVG